MSFGARHLTDRPVAGQRACRAFHSNLSCSTGVSWSFTLAVSVISVIDLDPVGAGRDGLDDGSEVDRRSARGGARTSAAGVTGVGLFDEPPQAKKKMPPARRRRSWRQFERTRSTSTLSRINNGSLRSGAAVGTNVLLYGYGWPPVNSRLIPVRVAWLDVALNDGEQPMARLLIGGATLLPPPS